jgi:protein-L-isoaspartate(D-aspartate) O-methyltransferase
VRRADFVPDTIWVRREDGWMVPLRRSEDPERWLELVDGGEAVATQVDDGTDEYDGKGVIPTSSSTAPWLVEKMLGLLDIRVGMAVLEIGTGTGYNAALLAERTRTGHVTTVELDPAIAEHAREALRRTGLPVTVVTGDGARGHPQGAPYDRVVATAGVYEIPHAWVAQTRPGGRILLPIAGSFHSGTLLCLTARGDGTARGRFHGDAAFMYLRDQRRDEVLWGRDEENAQITTTRLHPREVFTEFDAGFAVGTRLPGCVKGRRKTGGGTEVLRLSHLGSGSWASFTPGTGEHEVRQYGPRRLWDELETACRWWADAGRPDHTRFGLTVTPEGQTFWLDAPDRPVSPVRSP